MSFVVAGIGVATGAASFFSARKDKKRAQRDAAAAKAEMNKQRAAYENLDISNPFAGMTNQFAGLENTMEDLTVNQQQAQFEAQQGQQQRANIMANMSQAAGGSGIAALAQQMAQSGQLQAQQASASIGAQEAANQKAAAQQAAALQTAEAQAGMTLQQQIAAGDRQTQEMAIDRTSTLLGMEQSAYAGAQEREAAYKAQQLDALGSMATGIGSLLGG